ncbi:MAG: cell wall-binding repeat-containing protein [Actinomycetota bacterium]|nr:MAG: N-acetylmuramoyl-L-alanine [Actinomycetota bacterium]MDO8950164.1 cell wall-binding repeat-containing protein [Actinomycetota bacterium]MDP3630485.1 cell wall-binding repeat-containing protein [Actinomycetota bacterium]
MKSRSHIIAVALAAVVLASIPISSASALVSWPAGGVRVALDSSRIAGVDRYGTAVAIAREGFSGWTGVSRVVIACGENRSLADAVSAGGLVWAFDAPLLLVAGKEVPLSVRTALTEIRSANTSLTVTIVGGTGAVSAACASQVKSIVGTATVERPWPVGDRNTTAAGIALRMKLAAEESGRPMAPVALVANGTDAAGFFDALALSAVSAKTGAPVLFVTKTAVPVATRNALLALAPTEVIVAGGTGVVGSAVYTAVNGSSRLCGIDRYSTAVEIARAARDRAWLDASSVGVAGTVVDALTGASLAGRSGAPMLFTEGARLSKTSAVYLDEVGPLVASATIFGGTGAVSAAAEAQIEGTPATPVLVQPVGGKLVAKQANVKVSVGVNTTEVRLYAGSTLVGTQTVSSYGTADFGKRAMPASGITFKVIATNPDGTSATKTATYARLAYPAATSIVIDKSDFKLYWVKDDVLVKVYPIAIGRAGMETPLAIWRIDAKYKTDPSSVYGPRKMRMFRRYASGGGWKYVYTAYAIHGTNQEWVIGTKASHGCIRMYNKDVLELWPQVPLGTIVQTRL